MVALVLRVRGAVDRTVRVRLPPDGDRGRRGDLVLHPGQVKARLAHRSRHQTTYQVPEPMDCLSNGLGGPAHGIAVTTLHRILPGSLFCLYKTEPCAVIFSHNSSRFATKIRPFFTD